MTSPIVHDLYRALVTSDARGSAGRVVRVFMGHARASAAALLEMRNGNRLVLFTAIGAGQDLIDAARRALSSEDFAAGPVQLGRNVFAIVPSAGGGRAGLLALEAPRNPKAVGEAMSVLGPVMASAIEAGRQAGSEPASLRDLLEENEWNIARVARLLGVTRVTVYARMAAAGIPRLKVSRS